MSDTAQTKTADQAAEHGAVEHTAHGADHAHPSPAEYVRIAIILAIVTLAEVALYYIEIPDVALVVTLLVMSAVKFFMVAMWFMHLRFDSPIFRRLLILGIVMAFLVYTVVLLTFRVFTGVISGS